MSQHRASRIDETPSGTFSGSGVHRKPLTPGTRLGKYEVKRTLGSGGWAVVYEAEHLVMRHRVAVKVLRPDEDAHAVALERFKREARISAAVRHANVLDVYDVGHDDGGAPFLVMELLEGEDLDTRLMHGPLHVAEVLDVGDQLLSALEALESQGFVHRDIKPHNLFLHESDQGVVVKLLDFGIAREQDEDHARAAFAERLTVQGELLGTPHYMSPEQLEGEKLDCRTDIYAAAVTLYELLTGVTPFEGPTQNALIASILRDPVPDLHHRRPDCPQELADALYRALSKDREERWSSPRELRAELARIRTELGYPRGADAWSPAARMLTQAPVVGADEPSTDERRDVETLAASQQPDDEAPATLRTSMARKLALVAALALAAMAPFVLDGNGPEAAADAIAQPKTTPEATPEATKASAASPAKTTPVRDSASTSATEPSSDPSEPATRAPAEPSVADADETGQSPGDEAGDQTVAGSSAEREPAVAARARPAPPSTDELRDGARRAYLRGDVRRAHRLYGQLTRRDPGDPRAWRGLGTTAAALGRDAEAERALSRYLRAAPDAADAASIRARLRSP